MALHSRYTDGLANDDRVIIAFRREDLLWKTAATLTAPNGRQVHGLPIRHDAYAIGPTILDMMVRQVIPVTPALRKQYALPDHVDEAAFWMRRPTSTLWPGPQRAKPKQLVGQGSKVPHHPFQPGLVSGGHFVTDEAEFVLVGKRTTISISALALKLAVGMTGGLGSAYDRISALAIQAWSADLLRARALWHRVVATDQPLLEDDEIGALRPVSSISQEVERLVMRQACSWLGVDPDLDCSRPRGRPRAASSNAGKIVRVTVTADEQLHGELLEDFYGIKAGTSLADLGRITLVELLGALRLAHFEQDADLVEAFLDAAAPDWREQAASGAAGSGGAPGAGYDPYEILGAAHDAPLEEITKAYRRTMQKVHPDTSQLGRGLAQIVSEAYRSIRQQRGHHEET